MVSLILVSSLSFIGNTWGQEGNNVEGEFSAPALPLNNTGERGLYNDTESEQENETEANAQNTENELATSSMPLIPSTITVTCSAASNPCIGTDEDDYMAGDEGVNIMEGRKGDDRVEGGAGDDSMYGNEGHDIILGHYGDDNMDGGAESDEMQGGGNNDKMKGGEGNDKMSGESGSDIMDGGFGQDTMFGGEGDDTLLGYGEGDFLVGDSGSDTIMGFEGNDFLFHSNGGSAAADGSRDTIYCGEGYDEVWLNQETDHDTAYNNCEVIHVKDDPINNDPDKDFVPTNIDNCPTVSNNSQMDTDGDKTGDACDPYPEVPSSRESEVAVTVKFDSVTVHNDLVAYVQGKRIKLTDATPGVVCGGSAENCFWLWNARDGETYPFNIEPTVVKIPEKVQLSIYTAGRELDDCNRKLFPEVTISGVSKYTGLVDKGIIAYSQKILNNYATLCDTNIFGDVQEDDLLGVIGEGYDLIPGVSTKEVTSSTGDFTLRYTISVKAE
jgi:Ca2+-binding RTX toxin-like protein